MSPACFTHSARRSWTSRRDLDVHRGQNLLDKYHMAGEGLSNYAFAGFQGGAREATCGRLLCDEYNDAQLQRDDISLELGVIVFQ